MSFKSKDLSDMFRFNASLLFQESCPEESRFFLEKYFACLDKKKPGSSAVALDKTLVCQYCFQLLRPDNQRLRLKPKRRPSARVQRLLWRRAEGKALSLLQKRRLHHFWTSSSVLMATCHACSKTTKHKGMNREFLSTFPTPGNSGKRKTTPSTNKYIPGKDKALLRTPRSSTSSGTPGSTSSTPSATKTPFKGKNWVVRRLSKILMREEKPDNKKGSLKDFLSSL
ncbi:UPF0711 protein C18orf21 homolog isoform X2 [Syngnathus scovelli]|uniref:UPF0711 protein C18orf21 homolog isoform X2 n=1 Tax=Syngnathus scovelli TaxID=161590 RepID=UPI002110E46C|nr:UPF0711 protein C18orf21 homolog isoform X2 [Syngnathus scovelli]